MSDAQIASQPGATCRHPATPYGHATRPAAARAACAAPATACAAPATARRPQPAPSQPAVRPRSAAVQARQQLITRLLGPAALVRTGAAQGGGAQGRSLGAGLAQGRVGPPRQGGPKAGGGGARSACVARCPRPCVTAYLTWPSRLRARVQVRSGGPELALELEKDGYAFLDMDEKAFKDAE